LKNEATDLYENKGSDPEEVRNEATKSNRGKLELNNRSLKAD